LETGAPIQGLIGVNCGITILKRFHLTKGRYASICSSPMQKLIIVSMMLAFTWVAQAGETCDKEKAACPYQAKAACAASGKASCSSQAKTACAGKEASCCPSGKTVAKRKKNADVKGATLLVSR